MSYKLNVKCRACRGFDLPIVFDLGLQPLANDFVSPGSERQGFYPLAVQMCQGCGLAQLSVVVNPATLYRNYSYVSSSSVTMIRHYDRLFCDIKSESPSLRLLEIASNDGACLKFANAAGFKVCGIDPAENLAHHANIQGLTTIPEFFNRASAVKVNQHLDGTAGVVLARHVFAHIDDWDEFFLTLEIVSDKNTVICLEFPYAQDMLRRNTWDTIYHEHLSYVSLGPLVKILYDTPFHLHRVIHYGVHGGTMLVMLRHNDCKIPNHLSADEALADEKITKEDWISFSQLTRSKIDELRKTVNGLSDTGHLFGGFGASAKGTVLLNACGFKKKDVAFVTDNSPIKPGKLVPGTDIPVIEESQLLSEYPDYAICSAWNYRAEILEKMTAYRRRGGKFIFPTNTGWEIV
jgi:novobiocin biosynthesis protein NovU/D-mycarose 3-C-methyltransferase